MKERKRATRDEPERHGPHRNAALAVRPTSERAPPRRKPKGVVEQGVENAYRVYEEYMRRGREAAGELHRITGTGKGKGRSGADLGGAAEDALRYWQDLAEMWLSVVSPAGGRGRRARDDDRDDGRDDREDEARLAVEVALRSARPVEVTVDLRDAGPDAALGVQLLHAVGGDGVHRIGGVRFERRDGRLRLHLPVPDDVPPGAYFAVIVDTAQGEAVGTLRVVVRSS